MSMNRRNSALLLVILPALTQQPARARGTKRRHCHVSAANNQEFTISTAFLETIRKGRWSAATLS